jgi:putative photosynthetic complex assembly protein 2
MNECALAVLLVIGVWWLSTGIVLRVVWLPTRTHRTSLAVFTALALLGGYATLRASELPTTAGAYVGFVAALALWGWHEVAFLLGAVSGPRREPCRAGLSGWARFREATATVIHHELALAATLLAMVAATWGAPNQVATGVFAVLWAMRLSAKLNVFSGVRNISEDFVPAHLRYLTSYFRRRRFNPWMLLSLVASAAALSVAVGAAIAPEVGRFAALQATLVATMLALGLLEHVFLAVPLPDALLWRWMIRAGGRELAVPAPPAPLCAKKA